MIAVDREAEPVNVLVVDDRPENRAALKAILSSPDYRIVEAESGPEALRRLLAEEFAVLLLDVFMPDMDGFAVATAIRERERTAALPIVFLTAQASDIELVYEGYRHGAVDYLIKPLVPEMVRAKVAVFAELFRQRKRIEQQSARLVEAERRESELRLVELRLAGERRYRSLAEAVPHVIWTARPDGTADYFNRRWFEYTGISAEQASGNWLAALHPEDAPRLDRAWRAALDSGQMFEAEGRLRRGSDGVYRWHLCRAVPEHGGANEVISWLGTFTDIEDQKRSQEVLAEFKGTLDAVLDAVLIFEPGDLTFRYVNEGATALWGYAPEELTRMHPFELLSEYDESRFRELLAPLEDGSQSRIAIEAQCRRNGGAAEIPVEFSFQLVEVDGSHIVSIARDITDRKLAELERQQLYLEALAAVKARDEFLSVASHELRSPLSALKLQIEVLLRPANSADEPSARMRAKLENLTRQADRLARLISELMDVTRIKAGGLHLELEQTDLAAVTRDAIARFREDAAKANTAVSLQADRPVVGTWDRMRMDQVVTNLLTNALKFAAGKPVEVAVSTTEAGRAQLRVCDHGMGIAPGDLERIFERFERAGVTQKHPGLGLGLYIVRQIVDAHGGTIRADSQPGAGATFTVELPLEPPAASAGDAARADAGGKNGGGEQPGVAERHG